MQKNDRSKYCSAACRQGAYRSRVGDLIKLGRKVQLGEIDIVEVGKVGKVVSLERMAGESSLDFKIRKAEGLEDLLS